MALGVKGDWTLESLVAWLDREIDHQDIPAGESAEFLRQVIRGLMTRFAIVDIGVLALDRFRLRDAVAARIQEHRNRERSAAFQTFLLPDAPLVVTEQRAINFRAMTYEPSEVYQGGFRFKKHYFGPKIGELKESHGGSGLTEEFKCAQFLDDLPEVEFWVRNLVRKSTSFRLQTSTDWFYPDFVCQLRDGRILVVEYKGGHLYYSADSEEKRAVGAVWALRSGGCCLFVMPTAGDFSAISRAVGPV